VLDRATDTVEDLLAGQCGFAYRSSIFRASHRYVVLAVTFALHRDSRSAPVRYAELARALGVTPGDRAPMATVRETVLGLRASKGMVLDAGDPDTTSVGSFFTNPVLPAHAFDTLIARAGTTPASWPAAPGSPAEGTVKVSAAWLIEHAGFGKGYAGAHRGVSVSTKHTLALTNRGTGTTTALLQLAREIRDGVRTAFDVELQLEPVLVACAL
jgi:UDP-N-acetylmuramate dehydrogenase